MPIRLNSTTFNTLILYFQLLIGLHIWATMESYEVLGLFGACVGCPMCVRYLKRFLRMVFR